MVGDAVVGVGGHRSGGSKGDSIGGSKGGRGWDGRVTEGGGKEGYRARETVENTK